jgi:hypothetical protein
MIDTLDLWVNSCDISGGNPFEISRYLSELTERKNEQGYSCYGKMGDYSVYIGERGISLKGSLPKFYFGDNIQTLTRRNIAQAIEKLNDCLHIDLREAKVTRLDVSTIIPTKRPPADYYQYLGEKPRFNRLNATDSTLYYNNHQRQIAFYDKGKEAKAKGMIVPTLLSGNLLRYELRYQKRINKQFNADVTASTLYDTVFYRKILMSWYNEFKTIQKLKEQSFMTDGISTKKEAKEVLFAHLLQKEGVGIIDELLNELKAKNAFSSRSEYTKLKADLNKMLVAKNGNKSELIKELETYIYNVAAYAR